MPKDVKADVATDPPLLRRVSEAFVEGTLAAPFAFFDTRMPSGQVAPRSKESFWIATARYAVAGTQARTLRIAARNAAHLPPHARPYLAGFQKQRSEAFRSFDDGEAVYVHRPTANKMCFPAIWFVLPRIGEWRVITNTVGRRTVRRHRLRHPRTPGARCFLLLTFAYPLLARASLTYERWCARDGLMQQTARAIDDVGEAVSIGNISARNRNVLIPNAPLLRAAEGLDALTYAFYSSEQNTPHEAAGYLLCAMVSASPPCTCHCVRFDRRCGACAQVQMRADLHGSGGLALLMLGDRASSTGSLASSTTRVRARPHADSAACKVTGRPPPTTAASTARGASRRRPRTSSARTARTTCAAGSTSARVQNARRSQPHRRLGRWAPA